MTMTCRPCSALNRLDARRLVEILRLAPAVGQFQSGQPERLIDEHTGVGLALRYKVAEALFVMDRQRTGGKRNQKDDCVHESPFMTSNRVVTMPASCPNRGSIATSMLSPR